MSNNVITLDLPDGKADAYLARPDDGAAHPGVLLIMDAIGLRPQIEKMADRIASWGYVVLAPNMFYRWGTAAEIAPKTDLTDPDSRAEFMKSIMPMYKGLTDDLAGVDLEAYIDALHSFDGVSAGPIGITGYCMGGRLALLAAATRPDDVAAIGMFHSGGLVTDSPTSPHRRVGDIRAEVLAIHADQDQSLPAEAITTFDEALASANVTHTTSVYPGAAHGYTMADTASYHPEATEKHFADLRELFGRTLH